MLAAVQPTQERVECPHCKRLLFVVMQSGQTVISVKCQKCNHITIIDTSKGPRK
jgi:phage FluMu protein Com